MRTLSALMLSLGLGLAACGGGSKPATEEPTGDSEMDSDVPAAELCCCDYIEETGEGDEMAENQTYSMMPPADCEGLGACTDASACEASE